MSSTTVPSTEAILKRHLDAFGAGDMDAILADYTDDAVIVTNTGTYRGLDELPEFFGPLFEEFGQDGVELGVDQQIIEGQHAYITWHASTPDNDYEFATDTFDIVEGKITFQSFGAVVTPKA